MQYMDVAFLDGVAKLTLAGLRFGTNHDVYDKRLKMPNPWPPFNYVPHYIYFYHIQVSQNANLMVDHYEYRDGPDPDNIVDLAEIPLDRVPVIAKRLTEDARANLRQPVGHDFIGIQWRRRSYVVFVLDEPNWTFHKRDADRSSIVFNLAKGSYPNQSFFDAEDLTLPIRNMATGREEDRSSVYMVNHMTADPEGTPVGNPGQDFIFDMYVDAKYARTSGTMTVILDPGGTNQGPPQQP